MPTEQEAAIAALAERRATKPQMVRNADLYAGSPMHYYCSCCGHKAATLPETWTTPPPTLCDLCRAMDAKGWLTPEDKKFSPTEA